MLPKRFKIAFDYATEILLEALNDPSETNVAEKRIFIKKSIAVMRQKFSMAAFDNLSNKNSYSKRRIIQPKVFQEDKKHLPVLVFHSVNTSNDVDIVSTQEMIALCEDDEKTLSGW